MGAVVEQFHKIAKVQERYIAQEVVFYENTAKILTVSVDSVTDPAATDPALMPPEDAHMAGTERKETAGELAVGMLLKRVIPVYPHDAKQAGAKGTVRLRAIIGLDGGIHDLGVVSAPWPSLAQSALWAVSHWQYKPFP
jgi:TonB family protein